MTYKSLYSTANALGIGSEKKMHRCIEQLSQDLEALKDVDPALYWKILRNQHAIMFERHYSEKYANYDVSRLSYVNNKGEDCVGPHWTRAEVVAATKGLQFHKQVNDWDKYVAFNAMYADLCADPDMTDEIIIKSAYLFYFKDKDWQTNDDCTKIWDYMSK